jgi:hypothetical protein
MLLSRSHRFLFIHIFKTAGTSLRAVLEPYTQSPVLRVWMRFRSRVGYPLPELYPQLSGHARAVEVRDVVPAEMFASYFKFAFVRNPWDWQVSWYHFILQNRDHHEHDAVTRLGSFEDFLQWRIDHPVWKQKDFVTDADGDEIVDFVGRFENIEADFARVCEATNIRASLPHLNSSRHKDYRTYYRGRACRLLEEYSKDDIEYFSYRFEPEEVTMAGTGTRMARNHDTSERHAA